MTALHHTCANDCTKSNALITALLILLLSRLVFYLIESFGKFASINVAEIAG